MSNNIYDNWERLVAATLRREELWQLFHDHSRSPSLCSIASDMDSSINGEEFHMTSLHGSPSYHDQQQSSKDEVVIETQNSLPKSIIWFSKSYPAFDLDDLLSFSGELLGKGKFGSVYKASIISGITIVVKRCKLVSISETEFTRQIQIVGDVRHENVVPLRAYCSSNDEKLFLYDYYNKGSVSALLHGKNGGNRTHLSWEKRLGIIIGAARGLSHIHAQNGGKLVHGNIKSSNIFLNSQQFGCVSDLGFARMTTAEFEKNKSQASDVYDFGILLLELITRKSPRDVLHLVRRVKSLNLKEWNAEVFDKDIWKFPSIVDEMLKLLKIGISCVAKSPQKRPKMFKVVAMIEDVTRVSFERKLSFLEDCNHAYDLEDLLRSRAEKLEKGTFGSSYKVTLDSGKMIFVKAIKGVRLKNQDFSHHIEIIGRMRHENVAAIKAYYYPSDLILVYDFYQLQSLFASLDVFMRSYCHTAKSDWEKRLKIAIGAARGIAHIHHQDNSKLVHGNIKASNIFLNLEDYGLVTDVGLTKFLSPITVSDMPNPVYCAPEVTDTCKVSQASDVYSFGVVLLELISWRSFGYNTNIDRWVHLISTNYRVADLDLLLDKDCEVARVRLFKIARDCIAFMPENRPKMFQVVKTLEELIDETQLVLL